MIELSALRAENISVKSGAALTVSSR